MSPRESDTERLARAELPDPREGEPTPAQRERRRKRKKRKEADRRRTHRLARRHPDIEIARLIVKRGFVEKAPTVECLKIQKRRAKEGKRRIPFLQLLVKQRILSAEDLPAIQDEIRKNTYLCDYCDARAVILAGSQSRGGACPRCGHEISVDVPTDPELVPVKDFRPRTGQTSGREHASSGTMTWRPLGSRNLRAMTLGEVAFGRYLLSEELGRGAMGIVYRARHLDLNKDVALKVLIPSEEGYEHQVARFRREAAAVQKLQHQGIVQVHDFGSDSEVYYLTMDLVEGGDSLHRRLKNRDNPPTLRYRLDVLRQVARAVEHAHSRGVIHRDLKPANVLLNSDGNALVADFGLAKDEDAEAGELTRTQDRLGTPLFMAPEQIRKGASTVDARADVWALGVMLFACATGRYPFRSRTVMDLYLRILREDPDWTGAKYSAPDRKGFMRLKRDKEGSASDDPESVEESGSEGSEGIPPTKSGSGGDAERTEVGARTESGNLPKTVANDRLKAPAPFTSPPELEGKLVPPDLKAIISCALAKDPDDRYQSAAEFADDIDRFLQGEKVQGGGPALLKRLRLQLWRRRVLRPLALVMGILAIVSSIALAVVMSRSEEREAALKKKIEEEGNKPPVEDGRAALLAFRSEVDKAWTMAVETNTDGGYLKAQKTLGGLIDKRPQSYSAWLRRGQVRLRLREYGKARADLKKAAQLGGKGAPQGAVAVVRAQLELMTGNGEAAFKAARGGLLAVAGVKDGAPHRPALTASLVLGAFEVGRQDLLSEAEKLCGDLVKAGAPSRVHALYARLALHRKDLKAAQARADKALAVEPDPNKPHMETLLVQARLRLSEGESARKQFRAASFAYPKQAGPEIQYLQRVGEALYGARKWDELLQVNQANARLTPWCGRLHYYIGNVALNRLSRANDALEAFRKAVRLDPYDRNSRDFYLALLSSRKLPRDRLQEAISFLGEEERVYHPRSAEPALLLAYVLIRQGKLVGAWRALDRSDMRRPPQARNRRTALARAAIVRLAESHVVTQLRKIRTFPRDPSADALENVYRGSSAVSRAVDRLEVGRIYLENSLHEYAVPLLESSLRENLPGRLRRRGELLKGVALVCLARSMASKGKFPQALEHLRTADKSYTRAPGITPDVLPTFEEFRTLKETPEFKALLKGPTAD